MKICTASFGCGYGSDFYFFCLKIKDLIWKSLLELWFCLYP
jgi:hypothetical protein